MDGIIALFGSIGTILTLIGLGFMAYYSWDFWKKIGSPGASPSSTATTTSGSSDLAEVLRLVEVIRVTTDALLAAMMMVNVDAALVRDIKAILLNAKKSAGKLNSLQSLIDNKSMNDSSVATKNPEPNPLKNVFGSNAQDITATCANLAGCYGENAVETFLNKAKVYERSITNAESFAKLHPDRRRTIVNQVKNNNNSIG